MSKYNIYLIAPENDQLLADRLVEVGLEKVSSQEIDEVKFDFYMTPKGQLSIPWWKEQYQELIPERYQNIFNTSYTATLIARTSLHTYAVTMGKSHFYVNEFCDLDFGVDIAQRIGDRTKYKMKNSDFFGGIKDRAITSNTDYFELDFQSGESVSFLKMRPLSGDDWGKAAITFGNSVQFNNIEVPSVDLGSIFTSFDKILTQKPLFPIPRSRRVTNEKEIERLNAHVADLVEQGADDLVTIFEYDQFGVSFVFSDDIHLSVKVLGTTYELDNTGCLTISDIKKFCKEKKFLLKGILSDVKIVMSPDIGRSVTKPLMELIDYKSEDGFFLRGGRWYQFNQDFVDDLHNRLGEIELSELDFEFKESEYKAWQAKQGGVKYKEYYYNSEISRLNKLELYDRQLDYRRTHRFEVCDIYDRSGKAIIVTKRGEPIDLGYAVDQASTVVKLINNGKYKTQTKPSKSLAVKEIRLLLIFKKRKTRIQLLNEIDSLTFQNKINDLYSLCREKGISFKVIVGYES